jgi:hypothetical protein
MSSIVNSFLTCYRIFVCEEELFSVQHIVIVLHELQTSIQIDDESADITISTVPHNVHEGFRAD